ncbi:MAG: hypothetical protein MPJ24_03740 [Pirellulaceae bacterium]|nr:hypothetical protein [Pirellulaceae bacterium]
MRRKLAWTALCSFGVLFCVTLVSGKSSLPESTLGRSTENNLNRFGKPVKNTSSDDTKSLKRKQLREGTRLNQFVGEFQMAGDRMTFTSKTEDRSFDVLENLALERIALTLKDNLGTQHWSIDGFVTEYEGKNYLFVTKATLKRRKN